MGQLREISRAHEANVVVAGNKTVMTWGFDYCQICALVDSGVELMLELKEFKYSLRVE
jgi:hypothetical protein